MPTVPCPIKIDCPCADSPITNYSAEDPDARRYLSRRFVATRPKLGWTAGDTTTDGNTTYAANGCMRTCYSEVSQQSADDCALAQAVECSVDGFDGIIPGNGYGRIPTFRNTTQYCKRTCPSGAEFYASQAAGTVAALSQAAADLYAYMLACRRADQQKLCLSKICAPICMSDELDCYVYADHAGTGGTWVTYGMPAWVTEHRSGNYLYLRGTPTAPGSTDVSVSFYSSLGSHATIAFQVSVLGLTNPTALPACQYGEAYTYSMIGIGGTGGPYRYGLAGGSLPLGLTINEFGVISGTPLLADRGSFSIYVMDSDDNSCTQNFTMEVAFPPTFTAIRIIGIDDYIAHPDKGFLTGPPFSRVFGAETLNCQQGQWIDGLPPGDAVTFTTAIGSGFWYRASDAIWPFGTYIYMDDLTPPAPITPGHFHYPDPAPNSIYVAPEPGYYSW